MRRIAVAMVLTLAAGAVHAVGCSKIEYADARDWPLDKAVADYCRSGKFAKINDDLLRDLRAQGLLNAMDARQYTIESASCRERQAMFGRVIQNVHKAELPPC